MKTADLLIIGAGPGGYETALLAARRGLHTVLVERRWLGGTCLNEGCIPTKCLCHSAETAAAQTGFSQAMLRKDSVVDTLKSGIATMLKTAGVEVVWGEASFCGAHTVAVAGARDAEGNPCDSQYAAANIIIATGSEAKRLPVEGASLPGVMTSRELLGCETLPESLCIVGGGVVGMEFASVCAAFGCKVTVVEFMPEILPGFDRDMAKRLRTSMKKRGVEFHVASAVTGISETGDGPLRVGFSSKGKDESVSAAKVLMATGRAANTCGLNLEACGVACAKRGIEVDSNFMTSVRGVYAVGDVNGLVQLAHVAKAQGRCALAHILGEESHIDFNIIPAAVFTAPELAMVGLTQEACSQQGVAFETHKAFYRANGKALSADEPEGLVKLIATPQGKVIGAHILGAHAADMIHEMAMLMHFGGSLGDIAQTIHAHPTLSEIVLNAAES
jgi:dihydrolipoamide dehydrogenase